MNWLPGILDALAAQPAIGYAAGTAPAAEPTAIAALALAAYGRNDAAAQAAAALVAMQGENGAVGIRAGDPTPGWPTSLAVVAWNRIDQSRFKANIGRAVEWLLANRGCPVVQSIDFGHNAQLVGWAYAEQTHSWVEPTAMAVLALNAAGRGGTAECREGIALLLDRQLPGGGLNYGNTIILGQALRPHVQPTGIALLALASATNSSGRFSKSIAWLRRNIGPQTTPLSLGWAVLGLQAHAALPPATEEWLAAAAARLRQRDGAPHKLALLALAAKGWPT
jgi:hypothetical protein